MSSWTEFVDWVRGYAGPRPSRRPCFALRAAPGSSGQGVEIALRQHAHDVRLLHDQEFLAVELHLGAGPLAEQDAVADLDVDRDQLAGLVAAAGADGDHLALRGLLLGGVGDDDPARGLFFGVDAFDDDAIVERTELRLGHGVLTDTLAGWLMALGAGD